MRSAIASLNGMRSPLFKNVFHGVYHIIF